MATKRKPSEEQLKLERELDRLMERARGRKAWRSAPGAGGPARTDVSLTSVVDLVVLRPDRRSHDTWSTRVYGIRMDSTFWPDAQLFYSGDGLYWRDPFARYALAWREGRPN